MTKAEKAAMRALEERIALVRAVAALDEQPPSPMTREEIEANLVAGGKKYGFSDHKVARGWFANSYGTGSVTYGCSDGHYHSRNGDVADSQHMGRMYRSAADAWRVIRREKAMEIAKIMADIEAMIADAEAVTSAAAE